MLIICILYFLSFEFTGNRIVLEIDNSVIVIVMPVILIDSSVLVIDNFVIYSMTGNSTRQLCISNRQLCYSMTGNSTRQLCISNRQQYITVCVASNRIRQALY